MCKRKIALNSDKKIEVISIYDDNGKDFKDILTETIKKIKIRKQMVIKYNESNKEDF